MAQERGRERGRYDIGDGIYKKNNLQNCMWLKTFNDSGFLFLLTVLAFFKHKKIDGLV